MYVTFFFPPISSHCWGHEDEWEHDICPERVQLTEELDMSTSDLTQRYEVTMELYLRYNDNQKKNDRSLLMVSEEYQKSSQVKHTWTGLKRMNTVQQGSR